MFLKSTGAIVTGATCYLKGYENMKFRQKEFKEKLFNDQEFAKVFYDVAYNELEKLLAPPADSALFQSRQNVIDSILNIGV